MTNITTQPGQCLASSVPLDTIEPKLLPAWALRSPGQIISVNNINVGQTSSSDQDAYQADSASAQRQQADRRQAALSSAQLHRFLFTIPEDVRRVQFCPVPLVLLYTPLPDTVDDAVESLSRSQGRSPGARSSSGPSSRLLQPTAASRAKATYTDADEPHTGKASKYAAAPAGANPARKPSAREQSAAVSRSQGMSGAQQPISPSSSLLQPTKASSAKAKAAAAGDQKTGKATGYRAAPAASKTAGKHSASKQSATVSRSQGQPSGARSSSSPSSRLLKQTKASLAKRLSAK